MFAVDTLPYLILILVWLNGKWLLQIRNSRLKIMKLCAKNILTPNGQAYLPADKEHEKR